MCSRTLWCNPCTVVRCVARCCTLLHAVACCRQHALLEEEHLHHLQPNPIAHAQIVGVVLLRQRGRVVLLGSAQHNGAVAQVICARCERASATISSRTAALRRPTCSGAGASTRNVEIGDRWAAVTVLQRAVTVLQRAATGCAALQHTGIRCAPLHMLCAVAMRCAIPQTGFQTLRRAASRTCR